MNDVSESEVIGWQFFRQKGWRQISECICQKRLFCFSRLTIFLKKKYETFLWNY